MTASTRFSAIFVASLLSASTIIAQQAPANKPVDTPAGSTTTATPRTTDSSKVDAKAAPLASASYAPQIGIQRLRPVDQRGINVFETPKKSAVPYSGFKLEWGAAFTQQFQNLDHSNTASPRMVGSVNMNQPVAIGAGFNNANANLYMNAQLAPGIRVALTSYMSARHHNEMWVKDGYLLIDESPIKIKALETLMQYVTVKAGHFEINYGDAHFRRTDNGNAMYNPLVGNYIMDAFTTQIGGEVLFRKGAFLAMGGVTGGEVRGVVRTPEKRSPAFLGKIGFDKQFTSNVRVRLTGSMLSQSKSANNTLYTGDRAGSRYYSVMDSVTSTEIAQAWSGALQPGFASKVHANVINPFVKVGGLELFGNIETAKGGAATEAVDREWKHNAYEATYRFLKDQFYVATRYNTAKGRLPKMTNDVSLDRTQFGGGWFITPNVMLKSEYVTQNYKDFPLNDIRSGGKFKGFVVEGVVAF